MAFLRVTDLVSHPCKTNSETAFPHILIFKFLMREEKLKDYELNSAGSTEIISAPNSFPNVILISYCRSEIIKFLNISEAFINCLYI
jgi:hypothetical protein